MRRVKDGSLTVDQALALAQANGQGATPHAVPVALKQDVALKLALASAGADVGLRQDAIMTAARGAAVQAAADDVVHLASMHLGDDGGAHGIPADSPPADNDVGTTVPAGEEDVPPGVAVASTTPVAALGRSDSDVADILRLYGLSQAPQANLLHATETETSSRTSPAPLFSMLAETTSISSLDPSIRVAIISNRARHQSALIALPHTYPELLAVASAKLKLDAKRIYSKTGTRIVDLVCLRDEDELYVSEGEAFRKPGRSTSLTSLNSLSSSTLGLPETSSGGEFRWLFGHVWICLGMLGMLMWVCLGEGDGWIKLNVGGRLFETTMATLSRVPDNMLTTMLTSDHWKT
jgi:hypothetical protein